MSRIEEEIAADRRPTGLRRWRWPLMIGGPVIILAIVAFFLLTGGKSEATDDAYIQAGKAPISTSIPGRVIEIDVAENQTVKAGQILFKLDAADFQAQADRAQAAFEAARLQVVSLRAAYDQQRLVQSSADQTRAYAAREAVRQTAMVAAGVASRQQAAEAQHAADLARDQAAVAAQQSLAALANLGPAAKSPDAYPGVLQARAALAAARLNIGYTVVRAPADGIVTRVDQLQVGAYVNTAQTLFWLISGEPWVSANFKEDQLGRMRIGQPAEIQIDALGGRRFAGRVDSFSPGAGDSFSALPAQNATGNWVKVVQRLPVRIAFDRAPPEIAARAGLSAKVTVDIRPGAARRASPR
ncbi:MAG TPA: HlyD family secretion protein [Caulobacteraceae bacterium]|nr:HlyD family secretion protein [Caulobacteraceae bacterium]